MLIVGKLRLVIKGVFSLLLGRAGESMAVTYDDSEEDLCSRFVSSVTFVNSTTSPVASPVASLAAAMVVAVVQRMVWSAAPGPAPEIVPAGRSDSGVSAGHSCVFPSGVVT